MCVPDILYKYKPIRSTESHNINEFTQNLVLNGQLYFSRFSELSDPNEAIFDYSSTVDITVTEHEINQFPNHQRISNLGNGMIHIQVDGRSGAVHVRNRIDQMYGILCLTANNTSPLMFDYYAQGHKGICIGFEWKRFGILWRGTDQHQQPMKIKYIKKPPIIDISRAGNFEEVFYSKWREYKHEQEYRLTYSHGIFPNTQNVLNAIKEIIFGISVSEQDKEMIMQWARKSNLDIQFYEAHLKPKSYNIYIKPTD